MAVKFLNGIDVDGSLNLATSDIPNLAASKITSGTFGTARIPNLAASKITSGTLGTARIPDLSATYATAAQGTLATNALRSDASDVYDGRTLSFGTAGNGSNTSGAFLTVEGNTDSSGEGSGRLFFREHNSSTAAADNYGMSMGYRGGSTAVNSAMGNSWTGLSQIGNGEWGMWGHDNDAAGALIMHGDRAGTYVDFSGNNIQGINNATISGVLNANGSFLGDGNLFLRSYNNDPKGIFFRDGFEYGDTNQYNLSITCHDDGDGAADGMMISAYDGVRFNVASGSTPNVKFSILNTEVKAYANFVSTGTITGTNLSGSNTGDQDLSSYLTAETFSATDVVFTVDGNDVVAGDDLVLAGGLTWTNSTKTLTSANTNTTYTVQDGELSQNNFTDADHTKLNGIEAGATTDQDLSGYLTTTGKAADSNLLDGLDGTRFYRTVTSSSGTAGAGWVTVAKNQSGRRHGEVIVSDGDSGDHAFIRIDWMRSYADSNFSVINVGGHQNRITGVRVLSQSSDATYGWKYLQVYVTTSSLYGVKINSLGAPYGYSSHTAVTPVVQDTLSGYVVYGNALSGLEHATFAAEEGIVAGGVIYASGGNSSNWNTAYTHSQATHAPTDANNYVHPVTAGNKHIPTGGAAGQFLKYSASGTAVWAAPSYTTNTDTQLSDAYVIGLFSGGTNVTLAEDGTISSTDTVYTLPSAIPATSVTIGNGVTLSESSDRADLLYINSGTSTWGGLQIGNTSNEFIFSLMGDGNVGGIYDDANSDWIIYWAENAGVELKHNTNTKLTTTADGVTVTGYLTVSNDTGVKFNTSGSSGTPTLNVDSSANWNFKNTVGTNVVTISNGGALVASGDVTAFSDARVKENVETLPNALESVKQMRGVTYNKIGEEKQSVGVIAQELEEVVPQLVHTDEEGMKSVAYGNITAVLIEALKEQQVQIEELKAKLDGLTK